MGSKEKIIIMNTNRFKQLLESHMGNVKPLLMEQPTPDKKLNLFLTDDGYRRLMYPYWNVNTFSIGKMHNGDEVYERIIKNPKGERISWLLSNEIQGFR